MFILRILQQTILSVVFLATLILIKNQFVYLKAVFYILKQLKQNKDSYRFKFRFFSTNRVDIIMALTPEEKKCRMLIIYNLLSPPLFMFLSKEDILPIVASKQQLFARTPRKMFYKYVNQENVVKVNAQEHKLRRKMLSSYFQFETVKQLGQKTEEICQEQFQLKNLKKYETLEQSFQNICQQVVCQNMFSQLSESKQEELNMIKEIQDIRHSVRDLFETPFNKFRTLFIDPEKLPYFFLTRQEKIVFRKIESLRNKFFEKVEKREKKGDIIDIYLEQIENNNKNGLINKEGLFQDFLAIFAGSIDPVTTLTSNTLYQLAKNEHILEKVQKEIEENGENYQKMDYLHALVKECLRVYTTSPFLGQSVVDVNDFKVQNNLHVPKGQLVDCSLLTMMTTEGNFEKAMEIKPERHLQQQQLETYMPFGGGIRTCFGQQISPIQAKIMVVQLVKALDIKKMRVLGRDRVFINEKEFRLQYRKEHCPACQTFFTPHCNMKNHWKSFMLSYNFLGVLGVLSSFGALLLENIV